MSGYIHHEILLFFLSACTGIGLLLGYDLLLALRRVIPHCPAAVAMEDLLYWICTGFLVFAGIYRANQGSLRSFLFLGVVLGAWLWQAAVNPLVVEILAGILGVPVFFGKKITKRLLFAIKRCKIFIGFYANKRKSRRRGRTAGGKKSRGFKGSRKVGSIEEKGTQTQKAE